MAPAKAAIGHSRRPWNSRTPFQIMPQAKNSSASENSVGSFTTGDGVLQKPIEAAPIR
jgi:hypothetical protein